MTGLDITTAKGIPVGATLERAYWQVPGHYGSGPEFDTQLEALRHAIEEKRKAVERHNEHYASIYGTAHFLPLPERITVDYHWKMSWPVDPTTGGAAGSDFVVSRVDYKDLSEAEQCQARIVRFAPMTSAR